jgi:hypothetical protein
MLGNKILYAAVLTCAIAIVPSEYGGAANAGESRSGTYSDVIVSTQQLVLANGVTVVTSLFKGSATFGDPADPGILMGDCLVTGLIAADGSYSDTGYCNYKLGDEGAYVIDFVTSTDGVGTFQIVGGSGKWDGATGSGTYVGTWGQEDRFGGTYELTFD